MYYRIKSRLTSQELKICAASLLCVIMQIMHWMLKTHRIVTLEIKFNTQKVILTIFYSVPFTFFYQVNSNSTIGLKDITVGKDRL